MKEEEPQRTTQTTTLRRKDTRSSCSNRPTDRALLKQLRQVFNKSSATCSALSKISVLEYENNSCGNQFSFVTFWMPELQTIRQYIYSQGQYNQKSLCLIRSVFT